MHFLIFHEIGRFRRKSVNKSCSRYILKQLQFHEVGSVTTLVKMPMVWSYLKSSTKKRGRTYWGTVVNDLRIRPQMAKFILTKWPHGSSLHTYRVPPGPLDQPWCTPIVSYSNRYTPTPELLGSLLLFWQAIFKLPFLLYYSRNLNGWWCKLTLTYRAK